MIQHSKHLDYSVRFWDEIAADRRLMGPVVLGSLFYL